MEDAGLLLDAERVLRPAEDGAVVAARVQAVDELKEAC